ncbi:hypothetical protein H5410_045968 [Solanum commersonii]|uniref:Uncharacterized protein n=1 Tax=Solanum commersonii TaxID=4109 RepID=A0A9J5XEA7_SOLCO|nr:hypothetical protein H5410_045968 [Solanum commersonii]
MNNFTHRFARILRSTLASVHGRSQMSFKACNGAQCKCMPLHILSRWAIWYFFVELFGDTLTAPLHRQLDLFLQGLAHWNKGDL